METTPQPLPGTKQPDGSQVSVKHGSSVKMQRAWVRDRGNQGREQDRRQETPSSTRGRKRGTTHPLLPCSRLTMLSDRRVEAVVAGVGFKRV